MALAVSDVLSPCSYDQYDFITTIAELVKQSFLGMDFKNIHGVLLLNV